MNDPLPAAGLQAPDHVLGVFERERLSEALSATHRAGFGPHTKVFDGQRSSATLQIARAGLEVAKGPSPAPGDLVVLVQAPGRVDRVAELFHQLGALLVAQAQRKSAMSATMNPSARLAEIAIPLDGEEVSGAGT